MAIRAVHLVLLLAISAIAACASPPLTGDPTRTIRVRNDTTTPVAVHVNGGWAGTYPAGADAQVPLGGHGGPPFAVEIRSPSGAVLSSMTLTADDVDNVRTGGGTATGGDVGCGWIDIAYGPADLERPGAAARPTAGGACP